MDLSEVTNVQIEGYASVVCHKHTSNNTSKRDSGCVIWYNKQEYINAVNVSSLNNVAISGVKLN